ncbi:MAG: hypothetical protein BWX64_01560 [Acidobacteria bacterium ADurb.Bin051]|nr:MAG: hypothetical protein BWX64_01560 [Acidobacteria bacterium ADurb.Bin051]
MRIGAEVPRVTTSAEASRVIVPRTTKVPRERSGSSLGAEGISRIRVATSQAEPPRKKSIRAISQPEIPRSTKLWTEKSASTPERVRKVP